MDEKKMKYAKIDAAEPASDKKEEKKKKEKKVKEPKPPKEKKVKEPKPPKEKKVKEPKPPKEKKVKEPKPPKEKKVKEPKPLKEKKVKEPKPPKEKKVKEPKPPREKKLWGKKKKEALNNDTVSLGELTSMGELKGAPVQQEESAAETAKNAILNSREISHERIEEEFVLPAVKLVSKKKIKNKPEKIKKDLFKKETAEKSEKESIKKEKAEKPKKEKVKKEKKPKEKKPREPMTAKDFVTIGAAFLALLLAAAAVAVKFFPEMSPADPPVIENDDGNKMTDVQIAREGVGVNLVQSEIPDVFYGFTGNYEVQYFQYRDNKMVPVKSNAKVSAEVDMGNEKIPVTIDFVQLGGKVFGIGLFRADKTAEVYFYNKMIFKLTDLPAAYAAEGKALLLASSSDAALTKADVLWPESFVIDLKTGKTERFLSITNRTIDMNGAGVQDFCMIPKAGYTSSASSIPFITSREYEAGANKQDIFVKQGGKEAAFAYDVYGKFFLTDGSALIYMRKTSSGFDVVRRSDNEETTIRSFYGSMSTEYLNAGDYILNKNEGKLYNLRTGAEKALIGYRISPDMMAVSPDGKYLVLGGIVGSVVDYQVHIFNLETGGYQRYIDKNYSNHFNLTFVNNTTAVYTVLDPNQAFEYVALDVRKAD